MTDVDTIPKKAFVKMSVQDPAALVRNRRRLRTVRFIISETVVVAITVLSALAGISARWAAQSVPPVLRILPVGAAVVAAVLPIVFFGDPKRRNRPRR